MSRASGMNGRGVAHSRNGSLTPATTQGIPIKRPELGCGSGAPTLRQRRVVIGSGPMLRVVLAGSGSSVVTYPHRPEPTCAIDAIVGEDAGPVVRRSVTKSRSLG